MNIIRTFFLFVVVLVSVSFLGCTTSVTSPTEPVVVEQKMADLPQVCFEKNCRSVEIADEPAEQKQGLMQRTHMDQQTGMLFVFDKIAAWPFWMKDTLIPLDIIWMDDTGTVVYISRNTPPCVLGDSCPGYGPQEPTARFVLELNGGQAEKYGIALGSVLTLPK